MAPSTVFITGSSSGIGLASAKLFHSLGWNVVATMRDPVPTHELFSVVEQQRMLVLRLDVKDLASIEAAANQAVATFGTVDVLVNNAGYGLGGLFEAISREQIQEQFDVNVFGVMDVTRTLLPHLRANPNGAVIINISSGAGFWALPMTSMYNASKFALEGFTEALSYELASQNILVKSVVPHGGVTSTDFNTRFAGSMARNPALDSYGAFLTKTGESFSKMVAGASISSDDVAGAILTAATDGKRQLRYFIGNDARGFVKARYESQSDEEYMAKMRSYFE
uniref:3-oxoacyl-(Acyl-carrier-protein) reductase n=1 Tax=Mycena chlorophos TaxID=658473 RepID=A0ABQ0L6U7_MYCCL|nr:3-oxoacyl-(acyl-carrier-protein) reductase [Mycena chlorophos]